MGPSVAGDAALEGVDIAQEVVLDQIRPRQFRNTAVLMHIIPASSVGRVSDANVTKHSLMMITVPAPTCWEKSRLSSADLISTRREWSCASCLLKRPLGQNDRPPSRLYDVSGYHIITSFILN